MKKTSVLLLASLLFASPVLAAGGDSSNSTVLGSNVCGPAYSCSSFSGMDGSSNPAISQLLNVAENCVRAIGFHGDRAFEEGYGLDYNRCFTAKTLQKEAQGFTITPTCCLVETSTSDECRLVCKFIGKK